MNPPRPVRAARLVSCRTRLTTVVIAVTLAIAPVGAQKWTNATGNLAYKVSVCGNLTLLSAVPDSPRLIAGIAERDLWVNTSGATWCAPLRHRRI